MTWRSASDFGPPLLMQAQDEAFMFDREVFRPPANQVQQEGVEVSRDFAARRQMSWQEARQAAESGDYMDEPFVVLPAEEAEGAEIAAQGGALTPEELDDFKRLSGQARSTDMVSKMEMDMKPDFSYNFSYTIPDGMDANEWVYYQQADDNSITSPNAVDSITAQDRALRALVAQRALNEIITTPDGSEGITPIRAIDPNAEGAPPPPQEEAPAPPVPDRTIGSGQTGVRRRIQPRRGTR